jgi:hypothetical protein
MIILILSWTIELCMYPYYANLLTLASRAWLSFPSGFLLLLFSPKSIFYIYNSINSWITPLPLPFNFFSLDFKAMMVISYGFFLLLLFSHRGIFCFVHIKKVVDTCLAIIRRSDAFGQHVRLMKVVEIKFLPHHLIHLGALFFLG